ncbi:MAG: IMP dehydrogenase [Acidimicrobiales bacterium]
MAEIEIGLGKAGRQAYGFDDIAIVPSRRTRDPEDTDIAWEIDAFRFDLPIMSAAMDTVTSPATAVALGQMGGVGVLHLEGLWTRYEDPEACFAEIAGADPEKATARLQELYEAPVQPELVTARLREIRAAGVDLRRRHPAAGHRGGRAGARCRDRPAGHPGDGRVGRARVAAANR